MSLFVDTGVFYAFQNTGAQRHEEADRALTRALTGEYGGLYTSDYVYDEAVTLVRARTGSFEEAKTVGDRILGEGVYPSAFRVQNVDEAAFRKAVETFETFRDTPLSFTDASTVALIDTYGIDRVLSFDQDFDGIVPRLDPGDA